MTALMDIVLSLSSYGTSGMDSVNGPQPCKPGYYCPLQTPRLDSFPCPAGTYSNNSALYAASQCDICDAGYYCIGKFTYEGMR